MTTYEFVDHNSDRMTAESKLDVQKIGEAVANGDVFKIENEGGTQYVNGDYVVSFREVEEDAE